MSIYFPRKENAANIPEEIFFSIIKYLRPGAIWLFCRPVSRIWKAHVDSNIERYYRLHALSLKSEREHYEEICRSEERTDHLTQGLKEDSLYVEILWKQRMEEYHNNSSFLVFRFQSIDIPESSAIRDLSVGNWEEKVTFVTEGNSQVCGMSFIIWRIEHFLFPGFFPLKHHHYQSGSLFRLGSHTTILGSYQIQYTLSFFDPLYSIAINSITVPFRALMTFSTTHVVGTEFLLFGSTARRQYTSALFDSSTDEVQDLLEGAISRDRRHAHVPWKWDTKALCEMCSINHLDRWCHAMRCHKCCFRDAVCIPHLARTYRNHVYGRAAIVEEILGFDNQGWHWGMEGGPQWGSPNETFLESDSLNGRFTEVNEDSELHLGVSNNLLPPSGHDPNPEGGIGGEDG